MKKVLIVLLSLFILFIILPYFVFYFVFNYTNNYISSKYFQENEVIFNELVLSIIDNNEKGKKEEYSKCISDPCRYEIKMPSNILYLDYAEIYNSGEYYEIDFFPNKKKLDYIQIRIPKITYHSTVFTNNTSFYLPFPISNHYIYFGSDFLILKNNWYAHKKNL